MHLISTTNFILIWQRVKNLRLRGVTKILKFIGSEIELRLFRIQTYAAFVDLFYMCAYIWKVKMLVSQSCLTFCDHTDRSPPGSSAHGILQARILEWVAILFFRGSSLPRDGTWASCIAGRFFTIWATREAHMCVCLLICTSDLTI